MGAAILGTLLWWVVRGCIAGTDRGCAFAAQKSPSDGEHPRWLGAVPGRGRFGAGVVGRHPVSPRTRSATAAVVAAVMALAGCSSWGAEPAAESTTLGGAVMALSLQPQEQEFAAGVNKGIVVLVSADGEFREVQTEGMDQGRVAFADGELYYMDLNRGYFTGNSSTTIVPARTTDQIEGLFRVSDGYVGVYNVGGDLASEFSDEYIYQVLHTTREPAAAQLRQVGGYSRALAACGDEVFGVAHDPGAVPGVLSLKRLHPREQQIERVTFPTAMEFESLESPCRGGTMFFLGMPTNPQVAPPRRPADAAVQVERSLREVDDCPPHCRQWCPATPVSRREAVHAHGCGGGDRRDLPLARRRRQDPGHQHHHRCHHDRGSNRLQRPIRSGSADQLRASRGHARGPQEGHHRPRHPDHLGPDHR